MRFEVGVWNDLPMCSISRGSEMIGWLTSQTLNGSSVRYSLMIQKCLFLLILLTLNPRSQCFGGCSSERVVYGKVCHLVPWSYRNQGQRFHHSSIAFFSSSVFLQLMAPVGGRSSFIRELQPKKQKITWLFCPLLNGGGKPQQVGTEMFQSKVMVLRFHSASLNQAGKAFHRSLSSRRFNQPASCRRSIANQPDGWREENSSP